MNGKDRATAYRTLRPLLVSFFQQQIETERASAEQFANHPAPSLADKIRTASELLGKIGILEKLPELLDTEFE
jgi:hypothetical protein